MLLLVLWQLFSNILPKTFAQNNHKVLQVNVVLEFNKHNIFFIITSKLCYVANIAKYFVFPDFSSFQFGIKQVVKLKSPAARYLAAGDLAIWCVQGLYQKDFWYSTVLQYCISEIMLETLYDILWLKPTVCSPVKNLICP